MQSLEDYIEKNYDSKAAFAKAIGVSRQRVNNFINRGCVVKGGYICSKPSNRYFVHRNKVYRELIKL